jgi:ketosteroid isomerase-like protein
VSEIDALLERLDALEARVRELEDERDIVRAFHRYNRAVDYEGDAAAFAEVFTGDAVSVVLDSAGAVLHHEKGLAEVHAYQARSASRRGGTPKHLALAPLVDIEGDVAEVENYFLAFADSGDGPGVHVYGRSRNVLVRENGSWRIRERRADTESTIHH